MKLLEFKVLGGRYVDYIVLRIGNGEHGEYWKVLKLVRLLRNPREYSQVETALEMHRDIVSATRALPYARQVLIGANILNPQMGLLWCYGVLVADYSLERAKVLADKAFDALIGLLQGTYRQALYRPLMVEEADQLLKRITSFRNGIALKGVPEPRDEPSRSHRFLGFRTGLRIVEMLEEVVRGLMDKEFIFMVLLEPAKVEQLIKLLRRIAEEQSKYSNFQENSGLSFNIIIPWSYTGSRALQRGEARGETESRVRNKVEQESYGLSYSRSQSFSKSFTRSLMETEGEAHSRSYNITRGEVYGVSRSTTHTDVKSVSKSLSTAHTEGWSRSRSNSRGYVLPAAVEATTQSSSTSSQYLTPYGVREADKGLTAERLERSFHEKVEGYEQYSLTEGGAGYRNNPTVQALASGTQLPAWGYTAGGRRGYSRENSGTLNQENIRRYSGERTTLIQPLDESGSPVKRALTGFTETATRGRSISRPLGPTLTKSSTLTEGEFKSRTSSETVTRGESHGVSKSTATFRSWSLSEALGVSHTQSRSNSRGISEGVIRGESYGEGVQVQRGFSRGISESYARSRSISLGVTESLAWGVGLVPSLGIYVSRMNLDEVKRLAYTLLENLKRRVDNMVQMGGFHTLAVLLAPDEATCERAKALFLGALSTSSPFTPYPLRVLETDRKLLECTRAFAFDLRRKPNAYVGDRLKYVTLLTAVEAAALTMPPRVEASGLTNIVENIPEFRMPDGSRYDIELGYVISHETGQPTRVRFGVRKEELLHALFTGITRSGKTNAALLFVSQAVNKLGVRAIVLDWKKDWRKLAGVVPKDKFKLYTLYSLELNPLYFNPLIPPPGCDPELWRDNVVLLFSATYGLGHRSHTLLWSTLDSLYEEVGLYDYPDDPGRWSEPPTLVKWYRGIEDEYVDLMERTRGRVPYDVQDKYERVLDRLRYYTRGRFRRLFGEPRSSVNIREILSDNRVVVIEAGDMSDVHKPFLLGLLATWNFLYRKFNDPADPPELLVLEEAHQVAFDLSRKDIARQLNITESIFDKMAAEAAGYNLYLVFVSQSPSVLSEGVRKNVGLLVTFKLVSDTSDRPDVSMITNMLARDSRLDHREVKRFITRLPIGWGIVRKMRTFDLLETEPVLVKFDLFKAL